MRSLTTKLTLAFLCVSLIGAVMASVFVQWRTRSEFDRFLFRQDTAQLVSALQASYLANGSWRECAQVLNVDSSRRPAAGTDTHSAENGRYGPDDSLTVRFPLLLVSADRVVRCGPPDRIGDKVGPASLRLGVPLEVDGRVVGYLLTGSFDDVRRSPELAFLRQVNSAILISALLGLLFALALGAVLARTLTRPIRELTDASGRIAQGELGLQVQVRSRDELGSLAQAFNRMSADLDASNQARKQMTADIAHDLRTPLSLILGYTEALSDGKLPGSPEIYAVMHQEANHLNRLIDDLRLISLAEAGELPLNRTPLAPGTLIERAAAAFGPRADQKNVGLAVEVQPGLPPVEVDPERMAQVLGNLLANALRYTPGGGQVRLAARLDGNEVCLQVKDSGPGIAAEDLPHIFDRFYRADKSRQAGEESGLGLTIVKSLVEAHGGRITAESAPGQGASFSVRLPPAGKPA
jgi:signal transduction histidine kinase